MLRVETGSRREKTVKKIKTPKNTLKYVRASRALGQMANDSKLMNNRIIAVTKRSACREKPLAVRRRKAKRVITPNEIIKSAS